MTYGSIPPTTTSQTHTPSHTHTLPSVHMVWLGYSVSVVRYLLNCGMWRLHLLRLFLIRLMFCFSLQGDTIPLSAYNEVITFWKMSMKPEMYLLKWTQIMWKLYSSTSTYAMLQYEGLGTAFIPVGHIKRLADESLGKKKQNFWVRVKPTNLKN